MIDSRECLSIEDSGVILVRASGSTWITYKCIAMKRILSKYIYIVLILNMLLHFQ